MSQLSSELVSIPVKTLIDIYATLKKAEKIVKQASTVRIEIVATSRRVEEILQEVSPGILLRMQIEQKDE